MGYNLGVCPQCNNVMSMPDDSNLVRCPTCQAEVVAAEAAALAGASGNNGVQQSGDPYANAANMPVYPTPPVNGVAPLLGKWQTNVLFTVLGIVATMILNGFAGGSVDAEGNVQGGAMTGVLALAYLVFCIVYAVKIYPSYFSDKPMIESNEAISFLNAFVGGIIFGLIWNHYLTLGNKGIAHIVFVALIGASFVLAILAVVLLSAGVVASMA
jgi:hypothetical protein